MRKVTHRQKVRMHNVMMTDVFFCCKSPKKNIRINTIQIFIPNHSTHKLIMHHVLKKCGQAKRKTDITRRHLTYGGFHC